MRKAELETEIFEMTGKKEPFEIKGFYGFTVMRDSAGCVDVRYKGESVQGVVDIKVRAFNQKEDIPVLVLEIIADEWKTLPGDSRSNKGKIAEDINEP